jgi:hypothetical protein
MKWKPEMNKLSQVSDAQVAAALKRFINRLGVFISGRERVNANYRSKEITGIEQTQDVDVEIVSSKIKDNG